MADLVVLVDVDHTLLDGDRVRACISRCLDALGDEVAARFWAHYESVRGDIGRVDVPLVSGRVEAELGRSPRSVLEAVQRANYRACLYEGALEALQHLGSLGLTAVLSDGDEQYQRLKIERAGIADAVGGRVLVTTHKEQELATVERSFPASHYAFLDDRAGILSRIKALLGERCTTVLVRQGRYASEVAPRGDAVPDLELAAIRDVPRLTRAMLLGLPG
ncbi:MAG: HAD family hydrolase [Dehalococcoidia bacterium]|nr:HAD family hydrolase [Dehalococcoidia bacterium]